MELGILSLLPIAVLFILIFATKRMLLALTAATLTGCILIAGTGFAAEWLAKVQAAFMAGTIGYLCLLLALFGILIALFDASGYVKEFAFWLSKYANTKRKALIVTYILGWLIFVDDYLNNMAISTAMKKVCDCHKIPRTLLGYVVNGTAAPVCVIIPISTWAVFYGGLFEQYGVTVNGSGMSAYIHGLPFLFYAWISVALLLLVILGVVPMIGITKKHSLEALQTGIVCSADVNADGQEIVAGDFSEIQKLAQGCKPWNFLLPLAVLIAITIISGDVMVACMASILLTVILILIQKKLSFAEIFDGAWGGVVSMIGVDCIIVLAMTLVEINNATGMADYVVSIVEPLLQGWMVPMITFVFVSVYTYFCGGFWDGSMIFMPIVVPIANAVGADPLLSCCALVCAATCGSTVYVCGDAVQITSRAVDIKPFWQMKAALPYVLISVVLSAIAFGVAGFIMG